MADTETKPIKKDLSKIDVTTSQAQELSQLLHRYGYDDLADAFAETKDGLTITLRIEKPKE